MDFAIFTITIGLPTLVALTLIGHVGLPPLRARIRDSMDRRAAIRCQGLHVQHNNAEIEHLWIEKRLRSPGFHIDGTERLLLAWITEEAMLLDPEELGYVLPRQEELIALLASSPAKTKSKKRKSARPERVLQ